MMDRPVRILHLEDDARDAELVRATLEAGEATYDIFRVQTRRDFETALSDGYNLILADYQLPTYDGISALKLVKERGIDIPFIFVSGALGEDSAIQALTLGGTDYVLKHKLARLPQAVQRALRDAENQRQRKQFEERLIVSEANFRSLIESLTMPVIAFDREGKVHFANEYAANDLGVPREAMVGKSIWEIFPADYAKEQMAVIRRVISTETSAVDERSVLRDGKLRWYRVHIQNVAPQNEQPPLALGIAEDVTERRLAEEEYRRHQANLTGLIENSDDRIWAVDREYRLIIGNSNFHKGQLEALGEDIKPGQFVFIENAPSKVVDEWKGYFDRAFQGESFSVEKATQFSAMPQYRDYRFNPIRAGEQIVGVVISGRDITERKRSEETILQFSRVIEQTADSVVITNRDGVIEYVNPAFEIQTGYKKEEVIGQEPRLLKSGVHSEEFYRDLWDTIRNGQIFSGIFTNRKKNAELYHERKTITPLRDPQGTITHYVATGKDVTEHKLAEERLERQNVELLAEISERRRIEAQLLLQTTAVEAAANGIIITNPKGEILWANPAFLAMTGYHMQEVLGQTPNIIFSGRHDQAFYQDLWSTIRSGNIWRGETINRRKNGSLYVEDQTITPVTDEQGSIQYFIAIKQDVTERKRAEEALEQRNIELQALSMMERKQRQFSDALANAAISLNRSLNLGDVLPHILGQIRDVIPAGHADIMLLDGKIFYSASHRGFTGAPNLQAGAVHRFSLDDFPMVDEMCRTGKPVLILDTEEKSGWFDTDELKLSRSVLSAPLLAEERVIGFVSLLDEKPGFFTHEMCNRLVAFAAHAAVAIQNAWLFEQARAGNERLQSLSRRLVEVQENERRFIARELHDEAGQALTTLMLDLRVLEKSAYEPQEILRRAAEMEVSISEVIENLHRVAMALRPASLDHVGLIVALRQQVESVGEKHGLKVRFKASAIRRRLPASMEAAIYRIVQEALTNTVRHAHATQVDVVLTVRDGNLIVIIEDDGVGFDPEIVPTSDHLGLFGVRERAEMINGKLMIESAPGKGTTIMLEVNDVDSIIDRG
jgi:PAS domain S-box-containing protein